MKNLRRESLHVHALAVRRSGTRRRSFSLIELIVVIAVLLVLAAITLPSFLGPRGKAQDRAAQSDITVAYHDAKAAWADKGTYPVVTGAGGLLEELQGAEPGLTFVDGDVTGTGQVGVWRDTPHTVTICAESHSGRFYCLRADEEGSLAASASSSGPALQLAASESAISRATGSTLEIAQCYLANYDGEAGGTDCAAGEGAPTWVSSISADAPAGPGGDSGGTDPPALTLLAGPADSQATTATVLFAAGGGSATLTCALDGEAFTPCASPVALSDLPVGPHTFAVHAANGAGSDDIEVSWEVLAAPPTLAWVTTPADSLSQTATAAYTAGGGAAEITCALDGEQIASPECASPIALADLGYGEHTLTVHASNSGGVADPTTTWQVQTPGPELSWVTTPADSQATTATLDWTASGPSLTITCALDGAAPTPCPATPLALSGLAVGSHTFTVHAANAGGEANLTHTWEVIVPAPALAWVSVPADSASQSASLAWQLTGTGSITCQLDGAPAAPCSSPLSLTGLSVGQHTVQVHAANVSGAADLTHTWEVYAVPTAAFTAGPAQSSQTGATTASFAWTTTATTGSECSLDGAAFAACTSPQGLSGLGVGTHEFRVRASGPGGQVTITRNWEVLPQPTVTITGGPAEGSSSAVDSGSFTFSTTNASSTTCSIDGAPATACTSPYAFSNLTAASHTFQVNAISPAGTVSAPVRTWTVQRTYSQEVVASGASHYYRMNEATCADTGPIVDQVGAVNGAYNGATFTCAQTASGPLTGTTGSGNRYVSKTSSGTNNGGTTKATSSGSAWNFPSSAGYLGAQGSVEAWFKTSDTAAGSHFLFDKYNSVGAYFSGGVLDVYSYATANSHTISGLADGNWHHIVVSINGASLKVFVDGVLRVDATNHKGAPAVDNSRPFAFGWRVSGSSSADEGYFFNGAVDEIAFYPTALSLADAQAHYSARTR